MDIIGQDTNRQFFLFKIFIIFYLYNFEKINFIDISFILDEEDEIIKAYYKLSCLKINNKENKEELHETY